MAGYPRNSEGTYHSPAGWTNSVADPSSPAGGNGPGNSQPYPRRDAEAESWFWGAVHGAEHFADATYHAGVKVVHDVEDTAIRVAHVAQAIYLSDDYTGSAIEAKIRMSVDELKKAFIPGLLMSLGILAVTTFIGAAGAGLLVGVLSAGAGAVPAAIAGGELGLDAGFLILDALGIGFLLKDMFEGIPKIFVLVKSAVGIAWNAGSVPTRPAITDVEKAAHRLADAAAELVALIVEGVLVWILSKSAIAKSGKLAKAGGNLSDPAVLAARGREILQELKAKPAEMQAALAAGTAELSSMLRKAGSLTRGLADFIEKKFNQILENVTEDAGKKAAAKSRGGGVMGDDAAAAKSKSSDAISKRVKENAEMRKGSQFERDMKKAGVTDEQIKRTWAKQAPLGFKDPKQYQAFKQELSQALKTSGLDDAEVGMKGTATTFYSENPSKPLGHFWDADPANPGDYDLNLASQTMAKTMQDTGVQVSQKYGIYSTKNIEATFPDIEKFSSKWSAILGRDVNVVGYPNETIPIRDPTEFMLFP